MKHNFAFLGDGGRRTTGRKIRTVAECEDIRILLVLQSKLVYVDKASLVSDRLEKIGRLLRRCDVNEVILRKSERKRVENVN